MRSAGYPSRRMYMYSATAYSASARFCKHTHTGHMHSASLTMSLRTIFTLQNQTASMNLIYFMTWVNDRRVFYVKAQEKSKQKASIERKSTKQTRLIIRVSCFRNPMHFLQDSISILQQPADFFVVDFTAVSRQYNKDIYITNSCIWINSWNHACSAYVHLVNLFRTHIWTCNNEQTLHSLLFKKHYTTLNRSCALNSSLLPCNTFSSNQM